MIPSRVSRAASAGAVAAGLLLGLPAGAAAPPPEAPLSAGWASADVTPQKPVNLVGQYERRIARSARDPLTVTALALETRGENGTGDQAILVSCDVITIPRKTLELVREKLKPLVPDFDVRKLVFNATHTHTAPGLVETTYKPYDTSDIPDILKPSEYAELFADRAARAAAEAWKGRKSAALAWGLGYASVGTNRRACYADGKAKMYGNTRDAGFVHVEGYRDDAVEMLVLADADRKPTGVVVNIACTSQETEHLKEVSADFWHETREEIRRRLGKDLFILPQTAAAGDQSPHPIFRKQAEELMSKRRGLTRRQEIARRIAAAVEDVLPVALADAKSSIAFRHETAPIDIPVKDPPSPAFIESDSVRPAEIHVLRLGDVAMATSPFELYLDYGICMKARSPAVLTMTVQTACGDSGYLPTERGVKGGGYSAENYLVGPEGGKVLVEETVKRIQALWR
jgi:hypothetical protein